MFCTKCGCQLTDESVFCYKCGTKVNSFISDNSFTVTNQELDREALKIYLGDVLALECIKNKYLTELQWLEHSVTLPENVFHWKKFDINPFGTRESSGHIYLAYNGRYYIAVYNQVDPFQTGRVYDESGLNPSLYYWLDIESNIEYLQKRDNWPKYGTDYLGTRKYRNNAIKDFLGVYAEYQKTAPNEYREKCQNNSMMIDRRNGISLELEEVTQLLDKAYDKNIIPGPFRKNLHAIYYLHDFITTSNESFSTALLHFDLNEIKTKLDTVIRQQQEIIIKQSLMIAQNKQLQKQNQEHLQKLSQIEGNTRQAAQYAEIAAYNAEACAWISMANYLK